MSDNQQITRGLIETQRLVDEIRVFLQAMDRTDSDRLRLLSKQYASACIEVNDRLSRIFYFLRQGLRSEALHLADSPPAVMELLSVLDFTERAEWEDQALQYEDWTRPPALAVDTAGALNEAYALEESLKDLMSTHRLLALTRAPLGERVATLRAIAKIDSNNTIWQDDIKILGKARLAKLDEEIKAAEGDLNVQALTAIEQELASPDWGDAPIEPQRKAVKIAKENLKRIAARTVVSKLTGELLESYELRCLEVARGLREQFYLKVKEAVLDQKDPLLIKAAPALEWLKEEDEIEAGERAYHEAVEELEMSLAVRAPRADLEVLESRIHEMGHPIPPELESRVEAYFRSLDRRNRLAIFSLVGGLTGFALVCVVIAFWLNSEGQRRLSVEKAVVQIDGFLGKGRIVEARQAYQKLVAADPRTAGLRDLEAAEQRISDQEEKEKDRVKKFQRDLRQAKADALLNDQSSELEDLRKLAKLPEETSAVDDLANDLKSKRLAAEAASNDGLSRLLRSLEPDVEKLETQMKRNPRANGIDSDLARLRKSVTELRSLGSVAVEPNRSASDRLATRFEKVADARAALVRQSELERTITEVIQDDMTTEDLERFIKICKVYQDEFPLVARSDGLAKALKRIDRWNAILAWNQMVDEWQGNFSISKAEVAKERRDQVIKYRELYPKSPDKLVIDEYEKYLGTVFEALDTEETSPLIILIKTFGSDESIKNSYVFESKEGKRYYSIGMPTIVGGDYLYSTLDDLVLLGNKKPPGHTLPVRDITRPPVPSPQSRIAEIATKRLEKLEATPESWERAMASIIRQIRMDPEMDPIFKVILLKQMIVQSSRGSYGLGLALKDSLKVIEEKNIDAASKWMDPDDSQAKVFRIKARDVIDKLSNMDHLDSEAKANREKLQNNVFELHRPVGWLALDDSNHWQRLGPSLSRASEELWIASTADTWVDLGTEVSLTKRTGAGVKVNQEALFEGCLVFARRSKHRP